MTTHSTSRILEIMRNHENELCFSQYTDFDCYPARHCLLGWMANEVGIEVPSEKYNTHVIGMSGTSRFATKLQKEYGLTLQQLKEIQFANDDARDAQEFKRLVLELTQKWNTFPEVAT